MLRNAPLRLLLGGGTIITCYVIFYVTTTFCLSYVTTTLKLPRSEALGLLIAAIWAMALTTVLSCLAGDRYGRKPVLITGCVATGVIGLVMFPLLGAGTALSVGIAFALGLAAMGWVYGPLGAFLPELFDERYRYSASSFAYNLGGVLGGALAPAIAAALAAANGTSAVGRHVAGSAVLSLLCLLGLPETRHVCTELPARVGA
jgi:MFS family permease